jgi:glutathione S-transferase
MELVSFKLCPFVQRAVIILKERQLDCDMNYINPADPPSWFYQSSPTGKVPLLKVDNKVLFESSVICEYLDEISGSTLYPADPLSKALLRGWTEYASNCLQTIFHIGTTADEGRLNQAIESMKDHMVVLDTMVTGPFFDGNNFTMVDAAFAPLFVRLELLQEWANVSTMLGVPKVSIWSSHLLKHPSVKESIDDEFSGLYRKMLEGKGGAIASVLT